jgi:hypothetical protein
MGFEDTIPVVGSLKAQAARVKGSVDLKPGLSVYELLREKIEANNLLMRKIGPNLSGLSPGGVFISSADDMSPDMPSQPVTPIIYVADEPLPGLSLNRVKSATLRRNSDALYARHEVVVSQNNSTLGATGVSPAASSGKVGKASDPNARSGRTKVYESGEGLSPADQAKWRMAAAVTASEDFVCMVQGFVPNGLGGVLGPWRPGMKVLIKDDKAGIPLGEPRVIRGVTFRYDLEGGSTTTLRIMHKDGLTALLKSERKKAALLALTSREKGAIINQ